VFEFALITQLRTTLTVNRYYSLIFIDAKAQLCYKYRAFKYTHVSSHVIGSLTGVAWGAWRHNPGE
jgi:hypothetical protein